MTHEGPFKVSWKNQECQFAFHMQVLRLAADRVYAGSCRTCRSTCQTPLRTTS